MKALGFGAIVWDDIPARGAAPEAEPRAQNIGGAVFNVMAHLVRLGCEAAMVSAIGTDALGDRTMGVVRETGVDTTYLRRIDKPTCLVPVVFDAAGQPSYTVPEDVSWDAIEVTDADLTAIRNETFDNFFYGTIEQRSETTRNGLRRLVEHGGFKRIFLDVNLRPPFYSPEIVTYSLAHCTDVKINREEADEIGDMLDIGQMETEAFCTALRERFGIERVVVTDAENGACCLDGTGFAHCPGYRVGIADPVGAGDAFLAGLAYRLHAGDDLRSACDFGNRLGALIASKTSSIPQYDLTELEALPPGAVECGR